MKKLLALVLSLVVLCCSVTATAESIKISVTGSAIVTADPDIVTISTEVSGKDETILTAQQKLSDTMTAVLEGLAELGIAKEDIVTTGYYCFPNYDYSGETATIDGYNARHVLKITCRDLEMLDKVVSVLSHVGVNEINDISYDKADKTELYSQALAAAVAAAKEKAQTLATAAGKNEVSFASITESQTYVATYTRSAKGEVEEAMMDTGAASNIATQISSGTIEVSAVVAVEFEAE